MSDSIQFDPLMSLVVATRYSAGAKTDSRETAMTLSKMKQKRDKNEIK